MPTGGFINILLVLVDAMYNM